MRTAALLPTSGEPLLARYWCRNYERVWRGEVDELLVLINGPDRAAEDVYRSVGAEVAWVSTKIGHGEAIRDLVERAAVDIDAVVLVEDDAFVREPNRIRTRLGAVGGHLADVIGCPRGGMDPAIAVAAANKWGPVNGPDGSAGHGLWPAFLFARTADLMATSRRFESWTWQPGDVIPGLDYTVPAQMTTDTMTTVAFELRARHPITLDVNYKELDQKVYPGAAPYFHAGGLSNDPAQARDGMGDSNEGRDWAHRFWWWRRLGHDYRAPADLDLDYWTPIIEPWISWDD